jgi:replicative DNA helicase
MTRSRAEILDLALPHDHECERAILASALVHPGKFPAIANTITVEHFHDDANREIFAAMLRLNADSVPIDAALLIGKLKDAGVYNADNGVCAATVARLFELPALVANLPYYIRRLNDVYRRRRARLRAEQLLKAAHPSGRQNDPPLLRRRRNA